MGAMGAEIPEIRLLVCCFERFAFKLKTTGKTVRMMSGAEGIR